MLFQLQTMLLARGNMTKPDGFKGYVKTQLCTAEASPSQLHSRGSGQKPQQHGGRAANLVPRLDEDFRGSACR
jgi:hypothetical protein